MKAIDMLSELSLIEAGWQPSGFGYWMPTYTEKEWERLCIEMHAAQAVSQARLLANMAPRETSNRGRIGSSELKRA